MRQIDLDNLLNHWAKIIAEENHTCVENVGYLESEQNQAKDSEHLKSQAKEPWLKGEIIESINTIMTYDNVLTEKDEIVESFTVSSGELLNKDGSITKERREVKIEKSYVLCDETTTRKTLTGKLAIRAGAGFPGIGGVDIQAEITKAVAKGSSVTNTRGTTVTYTGPIHEGKKFFTYAKKLSCNKQALIRLSGQILVEFKRGIKLLPGKAKHKKWLITIDQVISRLKKDLEEAKAKNMPYSLDEIDEIIIDPKNKHVDIPFQFSLKKGLDYEIKEEVRPDILIEIENQFDVLHEQYKKKISSQLVLQRFYYTSVSFREYIDLSIEYLKTKYITNMMDLNKFLPSQQGQPVIIVGNAGTGKTTLTNFLMRNWAIKDIHEVQGLVYMPIHSLDTKRHCLYEAVAVCLQEKKPELQQKIITLLRLKLTTKQEINAIPPSGREISDYLKDLTQDIEWQADFEIKILMELLNRPILIIGPTGRITNPEDFRRFSEDPIFIYYDNKNHKYDAYVLNGSLTAKVIAETLLTKPIVWDDYEWVLQIPVGNLTDARYPKDKKIRYEVADIILKECFSKCSAVHNLESAPWFLIADVFASLITEKPSQYFTNSKTSIIKNAKVLIILDGYDENQSVPKQLKDAFNELMQSPRLLITSRYYGLPAFHIERGNNSDQNGQQIRVLGFADLGINQYINRYFATIPTLSSNEAKEKEKTFKDFLDDNRDIYSLCSTPIILQLMCMAQLEIQKPLQITKNNLKVSKAWLYETILSSLSIRFLQKYTTTDMQTADIVSTYRHCKMEIALTEHFAFMLTNKKVASDKIISTLTYLQKDGMLISNAMHLGFITPIDNSTEFGHHVAHQFSHDTFQYFFCARYLIACLWSENGRECKEQFPYKHTWNQTGKVSGFIHEKAKDKDYELVWEFIEGILIHYQDIDTLEYFNLCKTGQLSEDHKFIEQLAEKDYAFDLQRESDCLLVITCKKYQDGQAKFYSNLTKLQQNMERWLHSELLKGVIIKADDNDPILRIESETSDVIDKILNWLIYLTDKLPSKPMSTAKTNTPAFFNRNLVDGKDKEEEIISPVECRLQ